MSADNFSSALLGRLRGRTWITRIKTRDHFYILEEKGSFEVAFGVIAPREHMNYSGGGDSPEEQSR